MRHLTLMTIAAALVLFLPAAGALAGSPFIEVTPDGLEIAPSITEMDQETTLQVDGSGFSDLGALVMTITLANADVLEVREFARGEVFPATNVEEFTEPEDLEDMDDECEFIVVILGGGMVASVDGTLAEVTLRPNEVGQTTVDLELELLHDLGENEKKADVESFADSFTIHVTDVPDYPDISLDKSVSPTSAEPGDTVEYTFNVQNTGDVQLMDIVLTDDELDDSWDIDDLSEGETAEVTAEYTVPAGAEGSIQNTASVTAVDAEEREVSASATATLNIVDDPDDPPPPPAPDPEHTVTVEIEGEGEVDPAAGEHSFEDGEEVTLEATPATGWVLHEWLIDGDVSDVQEPELEVTVESDVTITAVFVEAPVILPYVGEFITRDDGGELVVEDQFRLVVPPGALPEDSEVGVSVETATEEVCPPDGPVDGNVFTVFAETEEGEPVEEFAEHVQVFLHYEEDVDEPENLAIYYYNEDLDLRVPLPTEVDVDEQVATAAIDRPGELVLCPLEKLTDIDGHWAEREILKLTALGAISGFPDETFRPEEDVTREQFITMLVETAGLELPRVARRLPLLIEDADEISDWAELHVEVALIEHIIEGYDDDTFRPARSINRAEIATIVVNALGIIPDADPQLDFVDEIPAWAQGYIAAAERTGIIAGFPDDTFRATDSATRAQAAVMLARYLNELE